MTTTPTTPQRIAIIGATGKVSRHVITQLHARGDDVIAIFRNGDRSSEIAELGATPVVLDIEQATGAALAQAIAGSDAVLFSAGAGGGDAARTRAVDFDGAVLAMAAASAAGVKRFVMVSAMGAGGPVPTDGDMVTYYQAKHDADEALMATGLDWTILRPGALTDDPATGLVDLAPTVERGSVPRSDVAAVIVAALDDPGSVGAAWEFASGSQPISEAIRSQG
ncbi:uncharacterized protein YbjT (DUF2867 family) [Salinibacterium sp. CAN_S4]|uniref:SDR family oxidoreductase n=1 Tax=Salinibacterium sp. CAN_S4 TaxID=2787727 RepID=UPI0018EF6BD5